jgi:hypothetical protein
MIIAAIVLYLPSAILMACAIGRSLREPANA